ncbi:DUF559 domain-containing protein [Luedemannella helvata]|uniref:DUF559 domain-containing protein n=1 Tax=Luedemannella helvata TaxID=349315 RepID=A0ABP4VSQ6_9ACTN
MDLPPDDADDLTWLLFRQDNVLTRRQAIAHLSADAVRHRLRTGRWLTLHRGVLLAQPGPVTLGQRQWAAVLSAAARGQAYLAGLSALGAAGLRTVRSSAIHVLLPGERRDRKAPPGVRVHRTRHLHADDLRTNGAPPATMPARSVVDAVCWAESADQARLILAATFQQRLVDVADVARVLERLPKLRRRPLILRTLADVGAGSHSLAELDLVRLCRQAGLPTPSRQVPRVDSDGTHRYLDLLFEEWGVHVEVDGAHHVDARQWWLDLRRQNALAAYGMRTLRFPAFMIREQPDVVVAQIRTALRAAGWPG